MTATTDAKAITTTANAKKLSTTSGANVEVLRQQLLLTLNDAVIQLKQLTALTPSGDANLTALNNLLSEIS